MRVKTRPKLVFLFWSSHQIKWLEQLREMFNKKTVFKKFCNVHRKTPVLKSLFNKVELPPGKFPPIKLPPGKFHPKIPTQKIPTRKVPNHVFKCSHPGFFIFLFFHYHHSRHWYYLKDCFVILCFKSAEVTLVAVYQTNLLFAGQNGYIIKKVLLVKCDNQSLS